MPRVFEASNGSPECNHSTSAHRKTNTKALNWTAHTPSSSLVIKRNLTSPDKTPNSTRVGMGSFLEGIAAGSPTSPNCPTRDLLVAAKLDTDGHGPSSTGTTRGGLPT